MNYVRDFLAEKPNLHNLGNVRAKVRLRFLTLQEEIRVQKSRQKCRNLIVLAKHGVRVFDRTSFFLFMNDCE